jgi:hypothetical protein
MSIAALALASSCNKILNPESTSDGYIRKTIHLSANEILTDKAAFGDMTSEGYPMLWQSGDKVVVSVNGDPDLTQTLNVTPIGDGSTADFGEITLSLPEGAIEFFISTNTTEASAGRTGLIKHSPNVDESQKPEAASCDPQSILLYAKKSYASAADVPDNIKVDFAHSTAYGKMTLSGISLNGGETVKFVEIQTPKDQNIGGNFVIADDGSLSGGSVPSIIIRNISDFSNPVWFAVAPTVLNSSSALMVHVVTSEDRHFEKILNCSSNPLEFNAGRVSKFTVNFSGISAAPRQVKTVRDLVLLKNALNNSDYNYWLNSGNEILLANDLEYGGASVTGNATDVPAGVTFNGQGFAIRNAKISATIFRHVNGALKNLVVEGGNNSTFLFNTIPGSVESVTINGLASAYPLINTVSGTLDGLTVDNTTTYNCPWTGNNMGFVAQTNTGLIENSEVAATINAGDPNRTAFNFGVFSPKLTGGRFVKCVNKSDVTIATSTRVNGCSLGGIVGVIESTQDNSSLILEECDNQGDLTLTLNIPESSFHRICCIGGIAGGDYKGGTGNSGVWKDASYPSSGVIYKCTNSGIVTMNYYSTSSTGNNGSVGITIGGVVGATINDISYCSNSGSVIANLNNDDNSNVTLAPKIGGVVGASHNKVLNCENKSSAIIEINGKVAKAHNALYNGTGPVSNPAFGGVAGCVGCGGSSSTNLDGAKTNSDNAGSKISDCINNSPNITNNTTYTANSDYSGPFLGSVCGWTKANNSGNTDLARPDLPIINPE